MRHPLLTAFVLSGAIHSLLFVPPWPPAYRIGPVPRIYLAIVGPTGQLTHASIEKTGETIPAADLLADHPILEETPENPEPSIRKRIWNRKDLDAAPVPIEDINLDPPEGLAREVHGKIVLSILIGESGEVLWSIVENSELEPGITNHVREKFGAIRFTPPRVRGMAVSTLIRIEIEANHAASSH